MRIAVAYEDGNVFQHFGHSEHFKLYDVEGQNVTDSRIIETEGKGHSALAALLGEYDVDVLICGGIGDGAVNALAQAGIDVCSGVSGNADEAVAYYLDGSLVSQGVNCNHHDEEQGCGHCGSDSEPCGYDGDEDGCGCGNCGDDEECGGCGSDDGQGCGGCSGCGGSYTPPFDGPNVGKTCRVHYKGTFNDGTQFDSSYDRGEPLEFVCGAGIMITGFDKAVATMNVGEVVDVHLMPSEAYGEVEPAAFITIPVKELGSGADDLKVDDKVYLQNALGQPFVARVAALTDTDITFDANHEMAGKELNFRIELVEVQ